VNFFVKKPKLSHNEFNWMQYYLVSWNSLVMKTVLTALNSLNSFKFQPLSFKNRVTFHYRLLFRCCSAICSISSCLYFSFFLWTSSWSWPPNEKDHTFT